MPAPPWIVGHRGAAGEAVENTVEAFRRGREAGVDMIELDVQLAADGELVCFHDWDLRRLGGRDEIVERQPSARLTTVPLGAGGTASMPTLGEALAAIPEPMAVNVELKRRLAPAEALVARLLEGLAGRTQVLVSSFDWSLLERLRAAAPALALAPLCGDRCVVDDPVAELVTVGAALDAYSLHWSRRMVTPELVRRARAAGFPRSIAFTVNDPEEAERFFFSGVSGVFTDVPTAMRARFRRSAGRPGRPPTPPPAR